MERYMAISIMRYDFTWLMRPGVVVLGVLAALVLLRPLISELRQGGLKAFIPQGRPQFLLTDLAYVFFIVIAGYMFIEAQRWSFSARIGPTAVAGTLLLAAVLSLFYGAFSRSGEAQDTEHRGIHMDVISDWGLPSGTVTRRAVIFAVWVLAFVASMALIGLIPTVPIFIVAYMRLEGREKWHLSLINAAAATLLIYAVFDQMIRVPWPATALGQLVPALGAIVPSM
jgi:hypothetical protein